ncbi:MAG: 2-hydroxymuconate tautomerase family protein [Albidovulum sp.]|nr:2-hydroxymuconate tautomerase family protein [Albidovulum sp.]MDE0307172.1 2-hydroxymuconate tautomerase family protein [Albidovulum sp.]MDE0531900.1 2-hydroxymuconate tautomerase family protein [Albidovulum sp.]
MAIVKVTILEGRDLETKNRLIKSLTTAVIDTLGAEPQQVRVVINEVKEGNYGVAGRAVSKSVRK